MRPYLHLPWVFSLVFLSCTIPFLDRGRDDFVGVQGTRFVLNGAPYMFAGTNMWHGGYLGSPGPTGDRPRLLRELDFLNANGITNLRILAVSEESAIRRSVKPAILKSPGIVDESLLEGIDFILAEMGKRGMRAVIYLTNYWEWSGGMSQYNVWTGHEPVDPENPEQGWTAFMNFSATFYWNPEAIVLHREMIRTVVTRRNSVNGRWYIDDPTIMAWQLANEPRPGREGETGEQNLPAFYRWIDESAAFIRSLDPNHLISTGSEGTVGALGSEEYFIAAHRTPNIDYLTFHLWPLNWGWFDPTRWEETLPPTEANAVAYINRHFALARSLGKPIVMDEFGIGRDEGRIHPGTPTRARDRYFGMVYRLLEDSVRAGAPFGGSNFWTWGGEGSALNPDGMWMVGDPFLGDPPQEKQGLNSVFISDTTTIGIIRTHAGVLKTIQFADSPVVQRLP